MALFSVVARLILDRLFGNFRHTPAVMQMLEDGLADSCVDCAMRHSLFGTIYLCSRMGDECARTPRHEIIAITITTHSSSRVYYDCRLVSLHTVVS